MNKIISNIFTFVFLTTSAFAEQFHRLQYVYQEDQPNTNLYLDAFQNTGHPNEVGVYSWQGGDNQLWTLTQNEEGYYVISPRNSNRVLDVNPSNSLVRKDYFSDKTVSLHPYNGGWNQQWSIEDLHGPYKSIKSRINGLPLILMQSQYLYGPDHTHEGTTYVVTEGLVFPAVYISYPKLIYGWQIDLHEENLPPQAANTLIDLSKLYGIRSVHNNELALETFNSERTPGINAQGGKYFATHNQLWRIREYVANSPYVYLENVNSGLVAHLLHTEAEPRVISEAYTGADNQLWMLSKNDSSQYSFTNKTTGEALALENPDSQFAPRVIDEPVEEAGNQLWILEAFDHAPVYLGNYQIFHDHRILDGSTEYKVVDRRILPVVSAATKQLDPQGNLDATTHYWQFIPHGDGYYQLDYRILRPSGHATLTINTDEEATPAGLTTARWQVLDTQLWKVIHQTDGSIQLQSKSGHFLGYHGLEGMEVIATTDLSPAYTYDWNIQQTRDYLGRYQIVSTMDNTNIRIHEDIHILTGRQPNVEGWIIENRNGRNYTISGSLGINRVMDIHGANPDSGAPIQELPFLATPSQEWSVVKLGINTFKVISVFSGHAMTVSDENAPHFVVKQAPFQNWASQIWYFRPEYEYIPDHAIPLEP